MEENIAESNEAILVLPERSLEARVGDNAVKELRANLEIVHPELEGLFFVPQDFAVFYSIRATLDEINALVTKEKYEPFLAKRLRQYLKKSAELRQNKGFSAWLHGENKHFYVDRTKLTSVALEDLSGQAYKNLFSEQIKLVDEIKQIFNFTDTYEKSGDHSYTTPIQKNLKRIIEEAHSYVRKFSIVPIGESTEHTDWESIIPVPDEINILWGAYERKQAKPFEAHGTISSQASSENVMPQYTLLEPQYGAVLSDKLFMLFEDFNKDLKQLTEGLTPYITKEVPLPPELQLELTLLNYFIRGLYSEEGNQLSGSYVTCMSTALKGIGKHLDEIFSSIRLFELNDLGYRFHHSRYYKGYPESKVRDMINKKTSFEVIEHRRLFSGNDYYTAIKPVK